MLIQFHNIITFIMLKSLHLSVLLLIFSLRPGQKVRSIFKVDPMCKLTFSLLNKVMTAILLFSLPFVSKGQVVIGNWTFNNTLTATSGANNTASNASLGSAIGSGQYNGGTVYFGEDGWPAGTTLNTNAYLAFTLTPNAGYQLHVSSIDFNVRRSTTGSPSGAGPRRWVLRSSLDGFTSDIVDNTLTTSPTTVTVTLGGAYVNLSSAITFRLYGFDVYNNPGGLNRFVFENITARGLSVLPVEISKLTAGVNNNIAGLSWNIDNAASVQQIEVQRSLDASSFNTVAQVAVNSVGAYNYQDQIFTSNTAKVYYRIKVVETTGEVKYSTIVAVSTKATPQLQINTIATNGSTITAQVNASENGNAKLTIFSIDGKILMQRNVMLTKGAQVLQLSASSQTGISVLSVMQNNQVVSKQFVR